MTKQKLSYKELFEGQWCPLFGAVPAISNNPHHDTFVAASCVDVIRKAREMWGVPQYDDWQWPNPNCPNEKITGIPGEYIVSVRKVFMKHDNISIGVLDDGTVRCNFLENHIRSTEGASINAFIGTQTRYIDKPKKIVPTFGRWKTSRTWKVLW